MKDKKIKKLNRELEKLLIEVDEQFHKETTKLEHDYKLATANYIGGECDDDEYFKALTKIGNELSKLRTEHIHDAKDSLIVRLLENAKAELRKETSTLLGL